MLIGTAGIGISYFQLSRDGLKDEETGTYVNIIVEP